MSQFTHSAAGNFLHLLAWSELTTEVAHKKELGRVRKHLPTSLFFVFFQGMTL